MLRKFVSILTDPILWIVLLLAAGAWFYTTGAEIGSTAPNISVQSQDDDYQADSVQSKFIQRLNDARSNQGLPSVQPQESAERFADSHTSEMVNRGESYHSDSGPRCGEAVITAYADTTIRASWAEDGEFSVYNDEELAESLFQEWMNSPPHREILLSQRASSFGFDVEVVEDGTVYATLEMC